MSGHLLRAVVATGLDPATDTSRMIGKPVHDDRGPVRRPNIGHVIAAEVAESGELIVTVETEASLVPPVTGISVEGGTG